ncbi:MAG: arsenate reductase (glutaredoxin) [Anaeromyxobacter sp.]
MAGEYVLWFDARCSASKRALALLRERGIEPELRRHLEEPPSAEELWALLHRLGCSAHAVVRTDEDEYQALRLSPRTPEPELVEALTAHPRILDRPILVAGGRAVIGRPPERVLELLPPGAPPTPG